MTILRKCALIVKLFQYFRIRWGAILMIVLCSKSIPIGAGSSLEKDFLMYYLSSKGQKAKVANEVWDALRFRLIKKLGVDKAPILINLLRGIIEPEAIRLKNDGSFEEVDPVDNVDEFLNEKTVNLVQRKWAEIDLFIHQDSMDLGASLNVKQMTLDEFYIYCAGSDCDRAIFEKFSISYPQEKYS